MHNLSHTAFLRINQILALIPISKSKLWADVKTGKFPAPIKLGKRCTAWRAEDVRAYIESVGGEK